MAAKFKWVWNADIKHEVGEIHKNKHGMLHDMYQLDGTIQQQQQNDEKKLRIHTIANTCVFVYRKVGRKCNGGKTKNKRVWNISRIGRTVANR